MQRLLVCCLLVWSLGYHANHNRTSAAAQRRPSVLAQQDINGTLSVNGYTRNFVYALSLIIRA
jgi:hypothetical protein